MKEFYELQKDTLRVSKNRHILSFVVLLIFTALLYCCFICIYPRMVEDNFNKVIEIVNEQHKQQYSEFSEIEVSYIFQAVDAKNEWIFNMISICISSISVMNSIFGSALLLQIYNIKKSIREYDEKILSTKRI